MCGRLVASAVAVLRLVEAEHCLIGCGVVLPLSGGPAGPRAGGLFSLRQRRGPGVSRQ
jgi:hypothetical protein